MEIRGKKVSKDELTEFDEYRNLFKPTADIKRLNDFATWLFTSITIITALTATFSYFGLKDLTGWGRILFGCGIISFGLSLASATLSLAPRLSNVNVNKPISMHDVMQKRFSYSASKLRFSAVTYALGIIFVASSPLLAGIPLQENPIVPTASLSYNLNLPEKKEDVKFETTFNATGFPPAMPVTIKLVTDPPNEHFLPQGRVITDEKGKANIRLVLSNSSSINQAVFKKSKKIRVIATWDKNFANGSTSLEIPLIFSMPVAKNQRTTTKKIESKERGSTH